MNNTLRTYTASDMAKIYCEKCNGCGDCCHGMTDTIHLDPYDVEQLRRNLGRSFDEMLGKEIGLHVEGGMVLPHLLFGPASTGIKPAGVQRNGSPPVDRKTAITDVSHDISGRKAFDLQQSDEMTASVKRPDKDVSDDSSAMDVCPFLDADNRCQIHAFRPGFCRLFPLGRDYDAASHSFRYFVVDAGCDMPGKMKVKISKWLGIPHLAQYERFVADWHYFCKDVENKLAQVQTPGASNETTGISSASSPAEYASTLNRFLLTVFYTTPYARERDFYELFSLRLARAREVL